MAHMPIIEIDIAKTKEEKENPTQRVRVVDENGGVHKGILLKQTKERIYIKRDDGEKIKFMV